MAYRGRSDREYADDRPAGREPKKARAELNEYFIKGTGIQREVLQKEICRFLGPEATSRPGKYKVGNMLVQVGEAVLSSK